MSKIAKTALSDPISQPFLPPAGQIFFSSGRVAFLARPRRTNAGIQASKHPSISFHPEHPYARHGPMRASDPISLVPSYNRKPAQSHPRIPAGIRSPTQPTTTASQHAPPHPCWHPAFYAANSNRKSAACHPHRYMACLYTCECNESARLTELVHCSLPIYVRMRQDVVAPMEQPRRNTHSNTHQAAVWLWARRSNPLRYRRVRQCHERFDGPPRVKKHGKAHVVQGI